MKDRNNKTATSTPPTHRKLLNKNFRSKCFRHCVSYYTENCSEGTI